MFKNTITFSQLKSSNDFLNLSEKEVLQVLHRGSEVKVVMTQEYYFYLLAMLERGNTDLPTVPHDRDQLMKEFEQKKAAINDLLEKEKKTAEDNEIVIGYDPNTSFGPIASDYNQSTDLVYRNLRYMGGPMFYSNGPQGQSTTLSNPDFTNLIKTNPNTTAQTNISFNGESTTLSNVTLTDTSTKLVDSMNGAIGETENDVDLVTDQLLKKSFWK